MAYPNYPKQKVYYFSASILKKTWMTKFNFLHAGKHEKYKLTLWFWWGWSSISKVSKIASLQCLTIFQKLVRVDFLHADKHQSALQVGFNTFGANVSYKVILSLLGSMLKYCQSTQSNEFANLCNISEKKLAMQLIYCMQIKIKVSKSLHYCLC